MQTEISSTKQNSLAVRLALGIILIVVVSLLVFYLAMRPPYNEVWLMALFLSITAVISAIASYTAYRMGWMYRSPTIRWTLIGGYVLSSILTFVNVWMTARLMFASQHDLILATVLLFFASGIAIALAFFLSSAMTDRIRQLDHAARSIAQGHLDTRIPIKGQDEIADLANTFNQMAVQLQEADRKKNEVENLRRDLIAWVSHDLQTPLASIRAIIEALADGMVDDPMIVKRYLQTAQKDISALSLLLDDLFQMAQLDAGGLRLDREDNSIADLVSDTLESFSELASRQGVHLSGKVQPGTDPVWIDAQLIGRVLNNLVSNALRCTPSEGNVCIQARRDRDALIIEISDSGEGISPEDLPFVFDRFYRGDKSRNRATGGAGLGLAIAQGIVHAHDGTISVQSQAEKGTMFTIRIPDNNPAVIQNPQGS